MGSARFVDYCRTYIIFASEKWNSLHGLLVRREGRFSHIPFSNGLAVARTAMVAILLSFAKESLIQIRKFADLNNVDYLCEQRRSEE